MAGQVRLLVGTRKGAFIYTSDEKRQRWEVSEPMVAGWQVFHMAADLRSEPAWLYAAANNPWWGPSIARSNDWGKTWDQRSKDLGFPKDMGLAIENIWAVQPGHESQPGVVFAGSQPPGLFRSDDWGVSWATVDGITRHEYREYFQGIGERPGAGSPLHSIEIDPRDASHVYVAISGGGSFETKDGGTTWRLFSHAVTPDVQRFEMFFSQIASEIAPGVDPAAVWDMHKFVLDRKNPDRMWTQAHTGVFMSTDAGQSWADVSPPPMQNVMPALPTPGLRAIHGFPIAVTQREPDAVYLAPLQADEFRVSPGQFTIYRSSDSGKTWEHLSNGLPGPHDYQSVYREGLDTDGLDPEGVYVGTSNGQVYGSTDRGDHWERLPGTLPPILSVTAVAS